MWESYKSDVRAAISGFWLSLFPPSPSVLCPTSRFLSWFRRKQQGGVSPACEREHQSWTPVQILSQSNWFRHILSSEWWNSAAVQMTWGAGWLQWSLFLCTCVAVAGHQGASFSSTSDRLNSYCFQKLSMRSSAARRSYSDEGELMHPSHQKALQLFHRGAEHKLFPRVAPGVFPRRSLWEHCLTWSWHFNPNERSEKIKMLLFLSQFFSLTASSEEWAYRAGASGADDALFPLKDSCIQKVFEVWANTLNFKWSVLNLHHHIC